MFFAPLEDYSLVVAALCALTFGNSTLRFTLCIDFSAMGAGELFCKIFHADDNGKQTSWLFRHVRMGRDVTWKDVEIEHPCILDFSNQMQSEIDGILTTISVSVGREAIESPANDIEYVFTLHFRVERADPCTVYHLFSHPKIIRTTQSGISEKVSSLEK